MATLLRWIGSTCFAFAFVAFMIGIASIDQQAIANQSLSTTYCTGCSSGGCGTVGDVDCALSCSGCPDDCFCDYIKGEGTQCACQTYF